MTLFEQYKSNGKIIDALLIGRNLLNKNAGNSDIFNEYFELVCSLAESLPLLDERLLFAEQANTALEFYSENVELNEIKINEINIAKQKLECIFSNLMKIKEELNAAEYSNIVHNNEKMLVQLAELKDKLCLVDTQENFDSLLQSVNAIELKLDKEKFTEKQNAVYDKLTKTYTDTISEKLRKFEHQKNIDYNNSAVTAFSKTFSQFKANENLYRNKTKLFTLVSDSLFAYDPSRLFNETLIYYNHVYSYLFSKLDDDGKLALTKFSIECEQNRRN